MIKGFDLKTLWSGLMTYLSVPILVAMVQSRASIWIIAAFASMLIVYLVAADQLIAHQSRYINWLEEQRNQGDEDNG